LNDTSAMHFNVIRTIMHSVRGSLDGTTRPTLWNWASTGDTSNMGMNSVYILYWNTATNKMDYNDSTTTGLGRWDYVISKAGQLGLKLNISLLDFWQWGGGVQQIAANLKNDPNYSMSGASDRYIYFFSDLAAKQMYKDWVSHVLNRVNSITGVAYKNDPTIMGWDLMNEPEMNSAYGQAWITEMAAYIKTIDTNHLLATGNEGFDDGHAGSSVASEVNNQPNIDFATWHSYPAYHGISTAQVVNLINSHCDTATAGGKPVIFQEFGYSFNNSNQATVYQSWVDALFDRDCAGWTFWRLTSIENSGSYPPDNGEGFDIHNDGSASANVFINAAIRSLARNTPQPTPTPCAGCTNTPTKTNTPVPTATKTNTPTPTTAPGTTIIDDSVMGSGQNQFNYSGGGWSHCTACNEASPAIYYNASQSWNSITNEYVTLAFTGTQVKYYAITAPHHGIAAVSIDGGAETNVDLYSAVKTGNVLVWTSPVLGAGSHTFKIRVTGTKNASSSGTVVTVDRTDVINSGGPTSTPSKTPTKTNTPVPTFQPATNTAGPTATKTNTSTPTKTNTPGSGGTNIAPNGTGYTWFNITTSYVGNQRSELGVNNGNLTTDFSLTGGGDDNQNSDEAIGVIWSTTQTITSVKYYNGLCDQYDNAPFTGNLRVQFSTDSVNWTTDSNWTVSPAYPYDSCSAGGQTYVFSGTAHTGVKGVRVIGTVRTTINSLSWHARGRELQVFN
jgi:mannan endo-1,4-beta-mannosidase